MPRFRDLQTDPERLAFIKEKLAKDDRWIARGILALFSRQTPQERKKKAAVKANGKGFNSYDAEILTLIAKKLIHGKAEEATRDTDKTFRLLDYMSESLVSAARGKMPKYAAQLLEFSATRVYPE